VGAPFAALFPLGQRELQVGLLLVALAVGLLAGGHPELAIAAAIGLAFVGVVLSNLTLGLCLFAIVVFLDLLPDMGAVVSFSKAVGLLISVSWLASAASGQISGRGFMADHPYLLYALVLFVGWSAASIAWAEDAGLTPTPFSRYVLSALLFVIVYAAIRERRHVAWLLGAYLIGAALAALYGFAVPASSDAVGERVTGSIGDPNELASVLLPAFIFGMGLAASLKRAPVARTLALAAAGISLLGLFLTLSRGGLVALAAAMVAALFLAGRWRPLVAVLAVGIGLAGLGYFTFFASDAARERVTSLSGGGTGREDIWTVGWRMFTENPVTGVGVGNFEKSSVHYLLEPGEIQRAEFIVDQPKVAHNTYLHVLAELGVVGFVLFMTIIGGALWCALRAAQTFARKNDVRMELLARTTLIGVIGLLCACFFISEMYSKQLWLLLGLCPPLLAVARRQPPAVEDPVRIRSGIASAWSAAPSPTARESDIAGPARAG
jgi:O-antigen ligase